ncbi:unnamed protein product, partial [Symbiodinium microadriaticum]
MHPDKFRGLALLNALMALPTFSRDRSVREQIHGLERVADEYQRVTGRQPGEDVMLGTLVRCLPKAIKQHVQLQMADTSTYQSVRDYVLGYELTTTSWTSAKMHQAFGVVPMPSTGDQGSDAASAVGVASAVGPSASQVAPSTASTQKRIARVEIDIRGQMNRGQRTPTIGVVSAKVAAKPVDKATPKEKKQPPAM